MNYRRIKKMVEHKESDLPSKTPSMPPFTPDFSSMLNIITLNSLGMFFFGFLIPFVVSQQIDASGAEMGLVFSSNIAGYMISSPIAGVLVDYGLNKKKMVLIGSFGRAFSYIILFFSILADFLIGIILGMFFLGFIVSLFWIPLNTMIAEKSSKFHRSKAYGLRDANIGKGQVIGAFIGFGIWGYANSFDTPNLLFVYSPLLVYCFGNILAGILFFRNVDDTIKYDSFNAQKEKIQENNIVSNLLLLSIVFFLIVLFLGSINGSLAKPFLLVYLLENLTTDPTIATFIYLPVGAVSVYLAPKLGGLADKISPYLGISIASLFGAIITFFLVNTDSLLIFTVLLTLDSIIVTVGLLIIQNFLSRVSKSHRGRLFGLQSTFNNLGGLIGPILGGLLWDSFGQKAPFYLSIGVEVLLIPFFIIAVFLIHPYLEEATD